MIKVNVEMSAKWNVRIPVAKFAKRVGAAATGVVALVYVVLPMIPHV
jgi:hypothetical protein